MSTKRPHKMLKWDIFKKEKYIHFLSTDKRDWKKWNTTFCNHLPSTAGEKKSPNSYYKSCSDEAKINLGNPWNCMLNARWMPFFSVDCQVDMGYHCKGSTSELMHHICISQVFQDLHVYVLKKITIEKHFEFCSYAKWASSVPLQTSMRQTILFYERIASCILRTE